MSRSQRTKPDRTGQLEIFPTPSWPVHALLNRLKPHGGNWFEPCAGEGHIIRAVDAWFKQNRPDEPAPTWESTDIRPTRYAQPCCDMTKLDNYFSQKKKTYSTIITNPPFSKALDLFNVLWPMAEKALVFLLPCSWMGSSERTALLRAHAPNLFILPERPIFRGCGTDQEIYAWFLWSKFSKLAPLLGPGYGLLHVLPATPVAARRASEAAAFVDMPADWHREVEVRRQAVKVREVERREKARNSRL